MEAIQMDMTGRGENPDFSKNRNQESGQPLPPPVPPKTPQTPPKSSSPTEGKDDDVPAPRSVYFQYLGQTDMTVVGPVTGTLYRFGRQGAIVAVDARDAETLARISHLRLINVRRGRWRT